MKQRSFWAHNTPEEWDENVLALGMDSQLTLVITLWVCCLSLLSGFPSRAFPLKVLLYQEHPPHVYLYMNWITWRNFHHPCVRYPHIIATNPNQDVITTMLESVWTHGKDDGHWQKENINWVAKMEDPSGQKTKSYSSAHSKSLTEKRKEATFPPPYSWGPLLPGLYSGSSSQIHRAVCKSALTEFIIHVSSLPFKIIKACNTTQANLYSKLCKNLARYHLSHPSLLLSEELVLVNHFYEPRCCCPPELSQPSVPRATGWGVHQQVATTLFFSNL